MLLILGFVAIEVLDPYGASSASDKLSREAFNAILAPWYDHEGSATGGSRPDVGPAAAGQPGTPETAQQASLVLLINDRSLEDSKLTWPLAANQLYYKLQALAEEHRPAAVFLDVLLTHERPDPRIPPEVRAEIQAQKPLCQFFDTDAGAQVGKQTLRSFATLAELRSPDESNQTPLGPPGIEQLVEVSDPASAFWCLKYHYRPVDGPTYPVDFYGPDGRYGTADDSKVEPRIPLIIAVPNPGVSRKLLPRLIAAERTGDFAAAKGRLPATSNTDELRERLLIPGLRGVATPAVVQAEIAPDEPGAIPLHFAHSIRVGENETLEVPLTTPAAAALVAFCRHHPQARFPGCEAVHAGRVDTLSSDDDRWRWERDLFLKWGVTSARTESYVKPEGADETVDSRADICVFGRDKLAHAQADSGWGGEVLTRLGWSLRTLLADAVRPDRPGQNGSLRARCSYIPTMEADLNYWPARPTKLMRTHPDGPVDLGDLIDGRVVFIGTNFDIHKDRTSSPVHETLPGVFQHAMAFDNLLRAGAQWRGPAAPVVGPDAGGDGTATLAEAGVLGATVAELRHVRELTWLDLAEIGALILLAGGGLALREWLSPTCVVDGSTELSKRAAAWEPILALCMLVVLVIGALSFTPWPVADVLMILATLVAHYRERLLLALAEVYMSFLNLLAACRRDPWRIPGVAMLLAPVILVLVRTAYTDLFGAVGLGVVFALLALFVWAIRDFLSVLLPRVSALWRRSGAPGPAAASAGSAERAAAAVPDRAAE